MSEDNIVGLEELIQRGVELARGGALPIAAAKEAMRGRMADGATIDWTIFIRCRKPCPGCGECAGNARRVSSDPEEFVIGGRRP
jgi:hypothetical protein